MKVLVVGGGAAGLMAAGAALRQGHEVTVLEHMMALFKPSNGRLCSTMWQSCSLRSTYVAAAW